MAFMFVPCIDLRKVTVSSSLQISLFSGAEASVDIEVSCFIIYSLSLFPLHFVAFRFYRYINFSTSAKCKNADKNRWMETSLLMPRSITEHEGCGRMLLCIMAVASFRIVLWNIQCWLPAGRYYLTRMNTHKARWH